MEVIRKLHPLLRLGFRVLGLRIVNAFPQQHHLNVAGSDAHLLRAPAVLPEREFFLTVWGLLRVVVTGEVAEAEEDVREAVL